MSDSISIRPMKLGEEDTVCQLVAGVFNEFVSLDFSTEGVDEFFRYAEPVAMARRMAAGSRVFLAEEDETTMGMVELRGLDHIAMLFVETQGRGVGRALVEQFLKVGRDSGSEVERVSVHASRYSVPFYRKLGFEAEGSERTENGITYLPMFLRLQEDG